MKYILVLFLIISFSLSHSQAKIKTFKGSGLQFSHPETWKVIKFYGYILIKPIDSKRLDSTGVNQIVVYPNRLSAVYKEKNIEKILVSHANILRPHEVKKNYLISKTIDNPRFIYKIEYEIFLNYNNNKYKKVEFISKKNSVLRSYSFMARADLFENYFGQAMGIINSVRD
ncbi:hypothetical protein Q2T40_18535 [Winogradskyella maritima]|uniref:Uncharacterized protein n=1 Tax=Winogradskyella maritima TaxID=1517766 RepID=A0ABV8ADS5_9FLAO|nr:hypothetical protein [Winogradskyella maritima]